MKGKRIFLIGSLVLVIAVGGLLALSLVDLEGPAAVTLPGPGQAIAPFAASGGARELIGPEAPAPGAPTLPSTAAPDRQGSPARPRAQEGKANEPTSGGGQGGWSQLFDERKIIRNGNLSLQVEDVGKAIDEVSSIVAGTAGAYVSASNTRQDNVRQIATITISVPSESFDQVMRQLRGLGVKVVSETVNSQDATEEYVDLQSQIRNLKNTEQQYLTLLGRANRIEEVLQIQQRLTEVRAQIERYEGRVRFLDRRSAYSNISVTLMPVPEDNGQPQPKPVYQPERTLERAFNNLMAVLRAMSDVAIYAFVYSLPALPVIALIVIALRRTAATPKGASPQ